MSWWGKLLGGAFGFAIGGPIGMLIGAGLGHGFDRGLDSAATGGAFSHQERAQTAFFTATFSVMGHIAKADGRVTSDEIRLASELMSRMQLSADMRRVARQLFTAGKGPGFALDAVLDQLRAECGRSTNLLRMFVEIQVQAAYADGSMHRGERELLARMAERLGLGAAELDQIEALVRAALGLDGGPGTSARLDLDSAYEVLGVRPEASDDEAKRAYRRLMNRHHPDKLIARGLPEEMVRVATEKTQEIKAAWERVRDARRG